MGEAGDSRSEDELLRLTGAERAGQVVDHTPFLHYTSDEEEELLGEKAMVREEERHTSHQT